MLTAEPIFNHWQHNWPLACKILIRYKWFGMDIWNLPFKPTAQKYIVLVVDKFFLYLFLFTINPKISVNNQLLITWCEQIKLCRTAKVYRHDKQGSLNFLCKFPLSVLSRLDVSRNWLDSIDCLDKRAWILLKLTGKLCIWKDSKRQRRIDKTCVNLCTAPQFAFYFWTNYRHACVELVEQWLLQINCTVLSFYSELQAPFLLSMSIDGRWHMQHIISLVQAQAPLRFTI